MTGSPVEVSWFSALCDDDYRYLGVPDPGLRSSFAHCGAIIRRADEHGFDNTLLPSGYQLGIEGVGVAAGVAPFLKQMQLLLAVRCGEMWPPQLARQLATLDQMLKQRLTINIISSDMPGETLASPERYGRTLEVMHILRTLMSGKSLDHDGTYYKLKLDPPRILEGDRQSPPFYFGGLSDHARDVAARAADVFLMWPDTTGNVQAILDDMRARAASHGRTLRFGYRVHVIVRETEAQARAHARDIMSRLDADTGEAIRAKSLDSQSHGVRRQAEMRDTADDDGFVEDHLWTGIGRARSGCGAAIVGDPDQVLAKLEAYRAMGIDAFILSGYPHLDECDHFARHVLPRLDHGALFPRTS